MNIESPLRRRPWALTLLLTISVCMVFMAGCAVKRNFAGTWNGNIQVQGMQIPLVIHVTQESGGAYAATLDSPAQKATGLKLDSFTVEGDDVKLQLNIIKGSYAGKSNAEATEIVGNWSQGGMSLPLTLKKQAEAK